MIYIITSTWQIPNKDQLNSSMSTPIFFVAKGWKKSPKTWAWHRSSLHVDHMPNLWGLTIGWCDDMSMFEGPEPKKSENPWENQPFTPWCGVKIDQLKEGGQHKQEDNHGINMNNFLHMLFTMIFFVLFFVFGSPLRVFSSQRFLKSNAMTNKSQTPKSIRRKKNTKASRTKFCHLAGSTKKIQEVDYYLVQVSKISPSFKMSWL